MKKMLKSIVISVLNKLNLYSLYTLRRSGALKEDGWFRSFIEKAPVDADGNPLPWITYPAIEFLKNRIRSEMSVFEYGCGNSTLWWASKVKEVISVQHENDWYQKIATIKPENVTLYRVDLENGGTYSKKISEFKNRFDIVVIDGRDRVNCAKNSLQALKPDGVIIWDNSARLEYQEGYEFLLKNGFRKIEFIGMCPVVNIKTETAVFYRDKNTFGI